MATFRGTELTQAIFAEADASSAIFEQAKLHQATFHHAVCHAAQFRKADLTYVDFSYADVSAANFADATLTRARLHAVKDEGTTWGNRSAALPPDGEQIEADAWYARNAPVALTEAKRCSANTQMAGQDFGIPDVCLQRQRPSPCRFPIRTSRWGRMAIPNQVKVLVVGAPAHNLGTSIPMTANEVTTPA